MLMKYGLKATISGLLASAAIVGITGAAYASTTTDDDPTIAMLTTWPGTTINTFSELNGPLTGSFQGGHEGGTSSYGVQQRINLGGIEWDQLNNGPWVKIDSADCPKCLVTDGAGY
ncbi:hypothetical protein ACFQ78_41625 [Streptomyces sp. NPDC056519]|uniref:hypothetical protein n=1 Tax=Streptomyces sp. NPDC056519 TaxID=3345849 RepID=UPI00367E27B2